MDHVRHLLTMLHAVIHYSFWKKLNDIDNSIQFVLRLEGKLIKEIKRPSFFEKKNVPLHRALRCNDRVHYAWCQAL